MGSYIEAIDRPTVLYIIYSMAQLLTYLCKERKVDLQPTYSLAYKCHHFIILAPPYVIGS